MFPGHPLEKSHAHQARIAKLESDIARIEKRIGTLRGKIPAAEVPDYAFADGKGRVKLSKLFGKKDKLILIHNMGKSCPYCTMWADGFNGIVPYVEETASFALASPDAVKTQQALAKKRGWRFRMVSARHTSLFKDLGFETADGMPRPGVTTFVKSKSGKIKRYASASFGPGDKFCSVFSFLDLLPKGNA
jgi:predicted dithiol-disulfide oxidoreductase (DUF899 family)